jgi:hypothetical protein
MSNFGDVRIAAHARDREALRLALADYDDEMVPPQEVVAYVKRLDATLWPVTWRGGDGASDDVLRAHKHEHPTLSAYIMVGSHKIEVLTLNDAEASVQRALLPIRREALDRHWMPRAQEYDSEEVREATRLLYACLDDPTLRAAATRRGAARDAAWDAARGSAWSAAWDCGEVRGVGCGEVRGVGRGEGCGVGCGVGRINHRVGAAIIKEVLS